VVGDDAVEVLELYHGERALRLAADPAVAPGLIRALVAAAVDVREITAVERSLEEVFFEMTAHADPTPEAAR
jgi:ABC-2 type transport system ATP-binding protein